ncbi:TPA: FAD-dependent monooxygenase [Bacillus pseudomycoides]|nr:FAD-dependent monooxygenase [Bacillus pseudomycoides]
MILPKYPDLLQVGVALPRGEWKETQRQGIEAFRQEIMHANKGFYEFGESLVDFKSFVPLQAKNHMVKTWAKNGCLLIGDAAHCSSPIGAIGVSLAVTTAVVAADVIWKALQKHDVSAEFLSKIQEIRIEEIEGIHQIQERIGSLFFTSSKFVKGIRPYIISAASKTPLFSMIQKKLLVMKNPVTINPAFIFNKE